MIEQATQSSDQEFRDMVRRMRKLQKEYFKTKNNAVLDHCKMAEKKVDAELLRDGQKDLFE